MSTKDKLEIRQWVQTNPGLPPQLREYFQALEARLRTNNIWPTTTTTTSSTTSTTSSSSSTSSSTSTTSSTTSSTTTTTTVTA